MLARFRALDPSRPLKEVLFYRLCYWLVLIAFTLVYRVRIQGATNIPATGGLLIVANHQSHLDPPLVGIGIRGRNMAAIARQGLFKNPVMGLLLRSLGVIPIRENEGDAGAIRAGIAQLKEGRVVVIFPEGSRSPDGAMVAFKRGAWLLMARAQVPVVPAAVEGCFDAWPRGRALPRVFGQRCAVRFGEPIAFETLKAMGPDAGLEHLAREVDAIRMCLRDQLRRQTHNRLPARGPGDAPYPSQGSQTEQHTA
jgi:1-acyl-sn-glycerol-3-phosphate acyltransferase